MLYLLIMEEYATRAMVVDSGDICAAMLDCERFHEKHTIAPGMRFDSVRGDP